MSEPDAVGAGHVWRRCFGRVGAAEDRSRVRAAGGRSGMGWHTGPDVLTRYVRGEIDQSEAILVERHLVRCAPCRASLGQLADPAQVERHREAVLDAIHAPRRRLERLLIGAGMNERTARLVVATPALRVSWLAAVTVALGFAAMAAGLRPGISVFLVIAPLLPVAGVAAAYGPVVDPTYEVGLAAPLSSLRLLLLRAAAVLATTVVLAAMGLAGTGVLARFAKLPIPHLKATAVAWLLPALGLTMGSIALSTVMSPLRAARLMVLAWLVTVAAFVQQPSDLFGRWIQIASALLAGVAGLVIVRRREALDRRQAG